MKLSDLSRPLGEEIALVKTENRLSRNLSQPDFTDVLHARLIQGGKRRIQEDTVLAIGIGDIDKPYAQKMDHLAEVRDGSIREQECRLLAPGGREREWCPLYGELYSQQAGDFLSENRQILKATDAIILQVGTQGI